MLNQHNPQQKQRASKWRESYTQCYIARRNVIILLGSYLRELRTVHVEVFLVLVFLKGILDKFHQIVNIRRLRDLARLFRPWQIKLE